VKFTVFPDADHDSWTAAYDDPELYRWLLDQRRPAR
jgi:predicted peptidase